MRRTVLTLLVMACGASSAWAGRAPLTGYAAVLAAYERGEFDAALAAFEGLAAADVERGVAALRTAGVARARAAALLHLEVAIAARNRRDMTGWTRHESIALTFVRELERIDARDVFPRTWRLLVIAYLHGQGDLRNALTMAADARRAGGDTPPLMLSVGATHEMAWTWKKNGEPGAGVSGHLDEAIAQYRAAIAADPALIEARVRLGRALSLAGDTSEALQVLASVPSGEPGFVYLARLFEGEAHETRGDLSAAARAYEAAAQAMPGGQAARIAMAHLDHAQGQRPVAAERIARTAASREAESADAWFWYTRGMAWRADPYLATLRAIVMRR